MTPSDFTHWATLSSEALLLVDKEGRILGAGDGVRHVGLSPDDIAGKSLPDLATTPAEAIQDFLRLCSRTRRPICSSLMLRDGSETDIACRCDGMLAHYGSGGGETTILLKLTPKQDAARPYLLVNEKIEELNKELRLRLKAEEELRRSHETFLNLVQNAPFGVYVIDADFRLRQVSAGAQKVFSKVRPLIGRDFAEVLRTVWPEPFASETIAIFRHTLETGEPFFHSPDTTEKRGDSDDVESYDWQIGRISLPDGGFGVVCYFYDLSGQRRAEWAVRESEERLRAAAEAAQFGVYDINLETGKAYWSPDAMMLLGLPQDKEFPMRVGELPKFVHARDRRRVMRAIRDCLDPQGDGKFRNELRVVLPNGKVRWILAQGRTTFEGAAEAPHPVRASGTIVDLTDRKRLEEELRTVAAKLSEANRRKDEFLAMLAHELRNPLAPILNGLEIIKDFGGDPARLAIVHDTIDRQARQLAALVEDLLDISRITRGKLTLRKAKVTLGDVVETAVDSARPLIDSAGHHLKVDIPSEPIELYADPVRLSQVLSNLINNAAKYTPPGGIIRLAAEVQDGEVLISVKDTGIGIPGEMLDHIFEMFSQLGRHGERETGLGIGLTLVRTLVEMHGGKVEARSDGANKGSEFRLRLPREAPQEETTREATAPDAGAAAANRRVLIVDDNQAAAGMLAMVVEMLGNDVRTAKNGIEAVAMAAEYRPEIMLMDLAMPGMNGFEAASRIRQETWGRKMKLFALTGWGQSEDRRRSAEAGFDGHLVKPVSVADLKQLFL